MEGLFEMNLCFQRKDLSVLQINGNTLWGAATFLRLNSPLVWIPALPGGKLGAAYLNLNVHSKEVMSLKYILYQNNIKRHHNYAWNYCLVPLFYNQEQQFYYTSLVVINPVLLFFSLYFYCWHYYRCPPCVTSAQPPPCHLRLPLPLLSSAVTTLLPVSMAIQF